MAGARGFNTLLWRRVVLLRSSCTPTVLPWTKRTRPSRLWPLLEQVQRPLPRPVHSSGTPAASQLGIVQKGTQPVHERDTMTGNMTPSDYLPRRGRRRCRRRFCRWRNRFPVGPPHGLSRPPANKWLSPEDPALPYQEVAEVTSEREAKEEPQKAMSGREIQVNRFVVDDFHFSYVFWAGL